MQSDTSVRTSATTFAESAMSAKYPPSHINAIAIYVFAFIEAIGISIVLWNR